MTEASRNRLDVEALVAQLWPDGDSPEGAQVYAILDAARDPRIGPLVQGTGLEHCCLFAGPLSPALRQAAPHLVHLAPRAGLALEFLRLGWGQSWGILAIAPPDVTLPVLRRHFRTLLRVRSNSPGMLLFRFYDPRVLRVYLPTCVPAETARMFGPIRYLLCESADAAELLRFSFQAVPPLDLSSASHGAACLHPLSLRPEQVEAFDEALEPEFSRRLCELLRRHLANDTSRFDDESLRALVGRSLRRAKGHGLRWESSIGDFVSLAVSIGENFDTHPRIAALLSDATIERESRMRNILAAVGPREWAEIGAFCTHGA